MNSIRLVQMPDVKTWHNTRVFGKKKALVENASMMAVLTTESFTPIIEVDILAHDSHELLGFSEDRFQQMSIGVGKLIGSAMSYIAIDPATSLPAGLK